VIRYGSVCSGIEAATVAWHGLGWTPAWFSDIDPFPNAVLAHRFPDVPNLGDMNTLHEREEFHDRPIDLLVGGTPCQSFSVAGLRKGLDDPRGNLALVFLRLAELARPRWVVWENVPGVLSSNGGRDFGAFLGALGYLGYGWAYRVLDAQYYGVPQRRRRVFVVGCLGNWRRAGAVLFEQEGMRGDSAAGRGQEVQLAQCLTAGTGKRYDPETETLIAQTQFGSVAGTLTARYDSSPCGDRGQTVVAFNYQNGGGYGNARPGLAITEDGTGPLTANQVPAVAKDQSVVRRLTPRECERLQGFPDDWTLVPYRGKPAADSPRYKACGNSMAVPVMRWIGERIAFVDDIPKVTES
jgi:DNA (cytosine-5)-methyltransferase 1